MTALKDDLDIADGLAADNVYILDPCCGTGAYLAETLRRGEGALTGAGVKKAAVERVFGFEIMPAPFVVAHLQVGITMQDLDAPLSEDGKERAGVYLTNALTGWEEDNTSDHIPFPELEQERNLADAIKRDTPVLVVLGNPPYNGFAGVAVDDERELTEAYRSVKSVQEPEGQGLNDLYVRFFRMAERRIVDNTGKGIICFISNNSWLDGLSFTGMREQYLDAFDLIRIDCLNGDKRRTGKIAPDGSPDPSIFSTYESPVGIQVGTAITTLVRKADHASAKSIGFRHLWGQSKREDLIATANHSVSETYNAFEPSVTLGLPFTPLNVSPSWPQWPSLPDLFKSSFPGVKTSRDSFLVDIDENKLRARIADYFDKDISHEDLAREYPAVMRDTSRYSARPVRNALRSRGHAYESGFVRYAYRPFDTRWLYWEPTGKLLDEKRSEYKPHVSPNNLWLTAAQHLRKDSEEPQAFFTHRLGSNHLIERGASLFPAWLNSSVLGEIDTGTKPTANLSDAAQAYLDRLSLGVEDLFYHVLAVLHDPTYREANAGALRMEWPRIPLPGWPEGEAPDAADELKASADRGRKLAALLDCETPVSGVTEGALRPEIVVISVPSTVNGGNMAGEDFSLTEGWGHFGQGEVVMPGQGRVVEREYTPEERGALGSAEGVLGGTTCDVYLNERAYWRNVPSAVWEYKLGGYQVLKKWLSYRERKVLGRALRAEEVRHFTDTARRIAAILMETAATSA